MLWTRGLLCLPAADLVAARAHELSIPGSKRRSFEEKHREEAQISVSYRLEQSSSSPEGAAR